MDLFPFFSNLFMCIEFAFFLTISFSQSKCHSRSSVVAGSFFPAILISFDFSLCTYVFKNIFHVAYTSLQCAKLTLLMSIKSLLSFMFPVLMQTLCIVRCLSSHLKLCGFFLDSHFLFSVSYFCHITLSHILIYFT